MATVLAGVLLDKCEEWPNLALLAKVDTERYVKSTGKTFFETRFYIRSLKHATPEQVNVCGKGAPGYRKQSSLATRL